MPIVPLYSGVKIIRGKVKGLGLEVVLRIFRYTFALITLLGLILTLFSTVKAQGSYDPTIQAPLQLYNEARTVYLGNLARQANGVAPLRWNRQLTYAARWFSWDSTANRPTGYCGHQDTQGNWPSYRTLFWGYLGFAGAENAYCGYLSPEAAIQGWMNSPGHRANLLDPNSREIGVGYYRRDNDGRGYVTQDFGTDVVYAPVIIENEAISTTSPNVNLYIYDRSGGGGFAGFGAATQMMISNDVYFHGAVWEPYQVTKTWTMEGGEGWKNVYVKTRDIFNRNLTASDTIFLGNTIPLSELGDDQMSTTNSQVTLYNLDGGALPQAQFSLGWLADDTLESFVKWWGNGERVNDAAAWGGTAYRLRPGNGESFAWVNDWKFPITDTPLVAYFRLKVNDNSSSDEVARISVNGGDTEYGPLSIKGTDFTTPNQYQEFALNFTFNTPNSDFNFLTFQIWRSGTADLYVDAVSIFSMPQAITLPLTWTVPGGNYRGQGVWVRYTNGSQFSEISEGDTNPNVIYGKVNAPGTIFNYSIDGVPQTVTAQADGNYSIPVPYNWTGTVTPSLPGVIFTPASRTYSNVLSEQPAQDYIATVTISGNTGLGGVVLYYIDGIPKNILSDSNGDFVITIPYGWIGSITPYAAGYKFYPINRSYDYVSLNQGAQNYEAFQKPSYPSPIQPPQDDRVLELRPTFIWSPVSDATFYDIEVSKNETFKNIVLRETVEGIQFIPSEDLPVTSTLYWRVRAISLGGAGKWSEIRRFETPNPPGIPILTLPNRNASIINFQPLFMWNRVRVPNGTQFDHYQIQVSNNRDFSTVTIDEKIFGLSTTMYLPTTNLPVNATYYWRLRAVNTGGEVSSWSEVRTFSIPGSLPGGDRPHGFGEISVDSNLSAPIMIAPLNQQSVLTSLPVLDWSDVDQGTSYYVQVSTDPTFGSSSLLVSAFTVESQYDFLKQVPEHSTLYWRVRVSRGYSVSEWSPTFSFKTP